MASWKRNNCVIWRNKSTSKDWHDRVTAINRQLQPGVVGIRDLLTQQRAALVEQIRTSRLLSSREFSFCLFDERLVEQLRV